MLPKSTLKVVLEITQKKHENCIKTAPQKGTKNHEKPLKKHDFPTKGQSVKLKPLCNERLLFAPGRVPVFGVFFPRFVCDFFEKWGDAPAPCINSGRPRGTPRPSKNANGSRGASKSNDLTECASDGNGPHFGPIWGPRGPVLRAKNNLGAPFCRPRGLRSSRMAHWSHFVTVWARFGLTF